MIATDGDWSLTERNRYFLACMPREIKMFLDADDTRPPLWALMAVNDLNIDLPDEMAVIDRALDAGVRLLIDSGVFWLTNRHKRAHGMTMDEALGLHPTEVDGFDWLLDRYVRLHERFGDRMWGMIELDQGGADRKRETRAHLHSLGIHPIPVYHPLLDGWEYFDELAAGNDRMCFGNIVQAAPTIRQRLLATAWERKRQYPHLWIHLLGYSLHNTLNACPVESCDSSSWKGGARWGREADKAMMTPVGSLGAGFIYDLADTERIEQRNKSLHLGALIARSADIGWRDHLDRLEGVLNTDDFR